MADDSVSPQSSQDTSSATVSPSDQSSPPVDIGQQPDSTWPNSTNLANAPNPADSNLANLPADTDASARVGDQQSTPPAEPVISEPPKEETSPQAPPSEIGQVTDTAPDTTWPDSTKIANEDSADSNLANSTPPTDQPVVLADSYPPSADSPIPSIPPVTPAESVSSLPAEPPPPSSSPSSPPEIHTSVLVSESPTPEVTPEPSEATKPLEEKVDTNVQSLDNSAPQVQSEAPNITPTTDAEKTQDNMANFKPNSPEQPQEAPLANLSAETLVKEDQNVIDSSQKSFGDLLFSENQPPPTPSTPSIPLVPSSPSVTFGDLIKDLKPEESVIPPAPILPEQTVPSSPPPQNPSSSSPTSPPPPLISPIPNLPPIANTPPIYQTPSAPSDPLSLRRQKANQVRSQKKAKHFEKIMELARNSKSISNTDIQRLLHVSQSTATNYLSELSRKGLLRKQGIRGGAKYSL